MIDDHRLRRAVESGFDVTGLKVLEPSCGHGYITRNLCEMGAEVTTFDIRQENLDRAAALCASQGYSPSLHHMDADNVDHFGHFGAIVHFGLLYHLELPRTHLLKVLGMTDLLLLDTHVCEDVAATWVNDGWRGAWWREGEGDYAARPGQGQSWWTTRDELRSAIERAGFTVDQLLDDPRADNGRRVMYLARRR